jgi:hypothetical protein
MKTHAWLPRYIHPIIYAGSSKNYRRYQTLCINYKTVLGIFFILRHKENDGEKKQLSDVSSMQWGFVVRKFRMNAEC